LTAKIISGTQVASEIRQELKQRIARLKAKGLTPALAVVLVGEDPASVSYVTGKAKASAEVGLYEETVYLPADTPE
jgi:methylenetetrahydrofolate dehydrogenase (NADP+)/methenyltetrahydrofolate cyclohydrolase